MEQVKSQLRPGVLLQERYLIQSLLGQGGFGAVYLVSDQDDDDKLLALKELRSTDQQDKNRLHIECEILQRLHHPSLPQVYHVFEENDHMYMLMEYIEGPNLEMLRRQQPGGRFPLEQVLSMLEPIVDAVSYLHQLSPPLVHRDIKPSNIVVSPSGDKAMLVDFGIVKEYHIDATATAIRHCTPCFSAPEQYSSAGTYLRTDIYGLGATCYALLCGHAPIDALQRVTSIASKGSDPLIPLHQQILIPAFADDAIQRALAINYEQRFATPANFWKALNAGHDSTVPLTVVDRTTTDLPMLSAKEREAIRRVKVVEHKLPDRRSKLLPSLALFALILLLLGGLLIGLRMTTSSRSGVGALHPTATTVPPTKAAYLSLAGTYEGTSYNLQTKVRSEMTLSKILQSNLIFTGLFSYSTSTAERPFNGVLDTSRHILITVSATGAQDPLFFEGTLRSDGNMAGNYCRLDESGQCVGEYGIWSVAPLTNP